MFDQITAVYDVDIELVAGWVKWACSTDVVVPGQPPADVVAAASRLLGSLPAKEVA
jgi:hypothetical protein